MSTGPNKIRNRHPIDLIRSVLNRVTNLKRIAYTIRAISPKCRGWIEQSFTCLVRDHDRYGDTTIKCCSFIIKYKACVDRQAELLEVPYFHVVFTVPEPIATIAFQNQSAVYDILFQAASETLRTIAADPKHLGAEIGFLAVLHTWGQNLLHHPHLHCLVPGGGIAPDGQSWIPCRSGFFLPVRVLSRMFRGLFLHHLEKAFATGKLCFFSEHRDLHEPAAFRRYLAPTRDTDWVVYAKRPFAGPAQVLDYVGRYTHRVAISNNRLVSIEGTGCASAGRTIAMAADRRS